MRFAPLLALLALLFALPAAAQSGYAVFATQAELDDGGALAGAVPTCLLAGTADGASGAFFWDDTSEVFATYDASAAPGSRTEVLVPAPVIDFLAGTNVTTCRDAAPEIGPDGTPTGAVFLVLSDADDTDFVARVDAATQDFVVLTNRESATDIGDGISSVAQVGETLYLARQAFFGAPEDGVYTVDTTTPEQTPTPLVVDPDLDLTGIASYVALPPNAIVYLYAVSSEFGEGAYQNVILQVLLSDPATIEVRYEPCLGDDPLFVNCTDGGLEDIVLGDYPEGDAIFTQAIVTNNSFNAPEGEAVATFGIDGFLEVGLPAANEAALIAETGISGYTTSAPSGYLAYSDPFGPSGASGKPTLFLAGSDAFGGAAGIYTYSPPFGLSAADAPEEAFAVAVSPNPAAGAARLTVTPEASGALRVDVADALGRTVAVLFDGAAAGGSALELRMPVLAPGVYSARISGDAGVRAERFTVVR